MKTPEKESIMGQKLITFLTCGISLSFIERAAHHPQSRHHKPVIKHNKKKQPSKHQKKKQRQKDYHHYVDDQHSNRLLEIQYIRVKGNVFDVIFINHSDKQIQFREMTRHHDKQQIRKKDKTTDWKKQQKQNLRRSWDQYTIKPGKMITKHRLYDHDKDNYLGFTIRVGNHNIELKTRYISNW